MPRRRCCFGAWKQRAVWRLDRAVELNDIGLMMDGNQSIEIRLPSTDLALPFQLDASNLRGRFVRLSSTLDEILTAHDHPEPVSRLLGEGVVLAALLASLLKYDGVFTLQVRSDGSVSTLVTDVTSDGALRGHAKVADDVPDGASPVIADLLGKGHLAFTVDQGEDTDRYQGIVELVGDTLTDCLIHYFRQSEQIDVGILVAVGRDQDNRWRGGGLLLQRLPDQAAAETADHLEHWRHGMIMMDSVTTDELLDPGLSPDRLLYRLFHEDGVRVFPVTRLAKGCRCTSERLAGILASLPRSEVEEFKVDGVVSMTCEFCNRQFDYDDAALRALFDQH